MRITLFDYGAGNLHSLEKALTTDDAEVRIEPDPSRAVDTDVLVLPGVGAFGAAAQRLQPGRSMMRDAILNGLPCIAICLGMQLLFDTSDEGAGEGLGVIPGRVRRLRSTRIPHMGWNALDEVRDPMFASAGVSAAYYAHSFVCEPRDDASVIARSTHETDSFAAAVQRGTAVGLQFHPEKSGAAGVRLLRALVSQALSLKPQALSPLSLKP